MRRNNKMLFCLVVLGVLQICGAEAAMMLNVPYNLTELEQRVEILEVQVGYIEEDISTIQNEVDDVEIDVNQQDDRITVVEATTFENTKDIADLSDSVEDTEDTIVLLLERMSALEVANNLQQEQIDTMQTTMTELEETVTEQSETIAELETTIAEQSAIIQLLQSTDNSTDARLDTVEGDVQEHDSELGSLTETTSLLENAVDDVEDSMTLIETQNEDLHQRLTAVEEVVIVPWVACTSSPCDNGGSCIDVNVDTFICMCRDGFYGDTCQYTPTIACASSPCTNGATCVDVNVDTFICLCRDGFFGTACEQSYAATSFLATFDVSSLTPSDPIVFNYAVLNDGGHYDVTSGIYTVPLDGIYEFGFHIYGLDDYNIAAWLTVDGVDVTYTYTTGDTTNDERLIESTVLLPLTAGQQVWVRPNSISDMYGANSDNGMRSWFTGHLVYAI